MCVQDFSQQVGWHRELRVFEWYAKHAHASRGIWDMIIIAGWPDVYM